MRYEHQLPHTLLLRRAHGPAGQSSSGPGWYDRPSVMRVLLLILAVVLCGCPSNEPQLAIPIEEESDVVVLSTVNVADPRAEDQLLEGFHGVEQRAWRWVAKQFSVALQPPAVDGEQLVSLDLKFTVPDVVIDTVGAITLNAKVNGHDLGSETYTEPGQHFLFTREIPAGVLTGQTARADFEVDEAMGPGEQDTRELAVIVSSIALK